MKKNKRPANRFGTGALNEGEMDYLNQFLLSLDNHEKTFSWVDGFFSAIAIAPIEVLPGDWLGVILGDHPEFESNDQAQSVMSMLMRHYNQVQTTLRAAAMPELAPVFLYHDNIESPWVSEWCHGFMQAVSLHQEAWFMALQADSDKRALDIVYAMTLLSPPSIESPPEAEAVPIDEVQATDFAMRGMLYEALNAYRQEFDPLADWDALLEISVMRLRDQIMHPVQSNACPCGSGLSFEECCGKHDRVVH